jgi:hypothetical protein
MMAQRGWGSQGTPVGSQASGLYAMCHATLSEGGGNSR